MQMETMKKIQTPFSDQGMGVTHIKEWYCCLQEGQTSVKSDKHSDRFSTRKNSEKIEQVW